jgi:tetratricopeptide (TPR) repeat protein
MALADLDEALLLLPLNIEARYAKAMSLYQLSKLDDALAEIERFTAMHPVINRNHVGLFFVACLISFGKDKKKKEEAKEWYKKGNEAIALFPQQCNFVSLCEMLFLSSTKFSGDRECYLCGKVDKPKQCGSCKIAVYCSRECQVGVRLSLLILGLERT